MPDKMDKEPLFMSSVFVISLIGGKTMQIISYLNQWCCLLFYPVCWANQGCSVGQNPTTILPTSTISSELAGDL